MTTIHAWLPVLLVLGLVFGSTLVIGLVAIWLVGAATASREPAFAGFCMALGWVMGGNWVPRHASTRQEVAVALGAAAALLLVWWLRVRPERQRDGADPD